MPLPNNGTMKCAHLFTNERVLKVTMRLARDQLMFGFLIALCGWFCKLTKKQHKQH